MQPFRPRSKRSFSPGVMAMLGALGLLLAQAASAQGCPFCSALKPTLAQKQNEAAWVGLAQEVERTPAELLLRWLHQLKKPKGAPAAGENFAVPRRVVPARGGPLWIVLGWKPAPGKNTPRWELIPGDELLYGYLVRAPGLRTPWPKRLRYFARFLEHPNPLVAEDAYQEFAHAPYEAVAQVAPQLPPEKLRQWILDPEVIQARKGLYALLLALGAQDAAQREQAAGFLQRILVEQPDGFRSGLDGFIGAYLLAAGPAGLQWVRRRWLAAPESDPGIQRHLLRALEVLHQYGPRELRPGMALCAQRLLDYPAVRTEAIRTLARWQHWDSLPRLLALWEKTGRDDARLRRWIVGYLLLCPRPQARRKLEQIRKQHPGLVEQVQRGLLLLPPAQ